MVELKLKKKLMWPFTLLYHTAGPSLIFNKIIYNYLRRTHPRVILGPLAIKMPPFNYETILLEISAFFDVWKYFRSPSPLLIKAPEKIIALFLL